MTIPIYLLVTHFVADFLLQSNWMATNKSKSANALGTHVLIYALAFTLVTASPLFGLWTFLTHFVTDFLTSKLTTRWWFIDFQARPVLIDSTKEQRIHACRWPFYAQFDPEKRWLFFVTVGFDQLIHFVTLALTYKYIFG